MNCRVSEGFKYQYELIITAEKKGVLGGANNEVDKKN